MSFWKWIILSYDNAGCSQNACSLLKTERWIYFTTLHAVGLDSLICRIWRNVLEAWKAKMCSKPSNVCLSLDWFDTLKCYNISKVRMQNCVEIMLCAVGLKNPSRNWGLPHLDSLRLHNATILPHIEEKDIVHVLK